MSDMCGLESSNMNDSHMTQPSAVVQGGSWCWLVIHVCMWAYTSQAASYKPRVRRCVRMMTALTV